MPVQTPHPSPEELSAYSLGQLPPERAIVVESHVSECEPCCETMAGLSSADTFVALLKEARRLPADDAADKQGVAPEASSPFPDVPPPLTEHPRYELVRRIGKGGMGDVYEARHRLMERTVALKIIKRELMRKPEAVARFHREVRTAAQLSHPNIVAAYDAEQAGDVHFLVMEHVNGVDLFHTVKHQGALPIADACDYVRQAAVGLQYAHERGMVHRDIKPHNLMVTPDGTVKILDFGLASLAPRETWEHDSAESSGGLTTAGSIMGTPDYIAPEQADDATQADTRSDIYSLGSTLYFLLSARPPFAEGSIMHKLKSHAQAAPEPIETLRDDVPPGLVPVMQRMLAKEPAERFQSPNQVAEALASFCRERKLDERSPERAEGSPRRSARRWATWAAVVAGMVGLSLVVVGTMGGFFGDGSAESAKALQSPEAGSATTRLDARPVLIRRFVGHQGPVREVAISKSGRSAASISGGGGSKGPSVKCDGMIRLWDLESGQVVHAWKGPSEDMRGLAFAPDEKRLLTAARHGNGGRHMQLWETETGREIRHFQGGYHSLVELTFVDDSRACSIVEDSVLAVWDIASGTVLARYPQPFRACSIDAHVGTSRVAVGLQSAVRILDLRDGSEQQTLRTPDDQNALGVAFSPDGKSMAAAVFMRGTLIWDIETGEQLHYIPAGGECVQWTRDGRHIIGGGDGNWFIYDTREKRAVSKLNLALRVYSLAMAPDGRSVLLGGGPRWHHPEDRDFALQHWRLPKQVWLKEDAPASTTADAGDASSTAPVEDNGATRQREKSDELVEKGRELFQSARFHDAANTFKEAIQLNPRNAAAHYWRAMCSVPFAARDEGQHRTAMRYLDKAIRLAPTNADYRAQRGLYLQERGKQRNDDQLRKRAIEDLTAAIQIRNDQYWWWFQRAFLRSGFSLHEEADGDYRQVIAMLTAKKVRNNDEQTHLAWACLNNCDNLIRQGDIQSAMQMGDKAVEVAPGMPKAHWNRARAYMAHHDFRTALDAAEKAIQASQGNYPDAFVLRSRIHEILGDFGQSRADNLAALQGGGGPPVARNLAACSGVLGRYEETLYLLDRVREAMPKDAATVYLQARAISELGDLDQALSLYHKALELDPAFAAAQVQRAVVLRNLQRVEEAAKSEEAALALLGEALKQDPGNAFALRQRARLWWDLGRFDEAFADWQRVVKQDDRDVFGLGNLALLLAAHPDAKKRDGRKAIALATKLVELTLGKGAFWLSVRAAAHAELGDFGAARKWQQEAIAACPHVEYGEYAERLALYERGKPYRLSAEETDPTKSLGEVVVPPHVPAETFEALQPAEATKQPAPQIAEQRPAIVLIKSDEGFGTGMILDQRGYVLTCAHVLPYSGPITVHYDDGDERREAEGVAVAVNHRRDLALLKFQPADGASLRTVRLGIEKGKPTKVAAGSLAVVIGNPGDRQWVLEKVVLNGAISSERQLLGDHVKQPYVQVEANVSEGCSGGPLFDDHGRVVGVVARKSGDIQRTGYAIPMDVVARFLDLQ